MQRKRLVAAVAVLAIAAVLAGAALMIFVSKAPPMLANRVAVEDLAGWPGSEQVSRIEVPPGASQLQFNLYGPGGAGAADIYARFGAPPTTTVFDASSTGSADVKSISIPSPRAGTYYLLLRGARGVYRRLSLVGSYAPQDAVFKVGMHAHRLYNGGDDGGPASAEPRFDYGVVRDWDISHLQDAVVWKPDDTIDFTLIDHVYSSHARHGAKVIKTFGTVPTWASRRPHEANPNYPAWSGALSGPGDLDRYENYVYRFVSHEKAALWAVEGWNEPYACPGDPPEFTTMTPTQLADVQKRIYRATKRVDPRILVFSPAQAYLCGIPTILGARTSEGEPIAKFFDALAWHAYNRSAKGNAGPSYANEVAQVRQYLAEAGLDNMPIVDTEHGWLQPPKEGGRAFHALSGAAKGQVLYDTAQLAKSLGVLAVVWYGYDDDLIGKPMTSPAVSARLQRSYRDLNTR
jgi:hypothetical protein